MTSEESPRRGEDNNRFDSDDDASLCHRGTGCYLDR